MNLPYFVDKLAFMRKCIFISTFLFFHLAFVHAQEEHNKHSIDLQLELCLDTDSNWTTYGMVKCERNAEEAWDMELNKFYKLLMNALNEEEREKLRHSQRQWLKYRDAEFEFLGLMYYNMQGTMYKVMNAGKRTDIVKQRALELQSYYLTVQGN